MKPFRLVGNTFNGKRVTGLKQYHGLGQPRYVIKTSDGQRFDVDADQMASIIEALPPTGTRRYSPATD